MLQVRKDADHTELYSWDLHSLESHALDRSKQQRTHAQRIGIRQAVRAAPLQPGALVIENFSPEKRIPMTMLKQRAVKRQVRKEREDLYRPLLNGIVIDRKQGSMECLAAEMDFERLINLHNSGDRPLDAHEPVCIGS